MTKRLLITGGSGFIGTRLVQSASAKGYKILNIDLNPPFERVHHQYWKKCDIMNLDELKTIVSHFSPTDVVHLAARTDCDESTTVESGYAVNTTGTKNVLLVVIAAPTCERVVVTSSQYVYHDADKIPTSDSHYSPRTVYGQSKIITEEITRELGARLKTWTIIRPTTVWGPWCIRHVRTLFFAMQKGIYFHPGKQPCFRAYGYVGNVTEQILGILTSPSESVNGKVYYVGDRPLDLYQWVNKVSIKLCGREVRALPRALISPIAKFGDLFQKVLGRRFLIDSTRYKSMVENFPAPMEPVIALLGEPPYSIDSGIDETLVWLKDFSMSQRVPSENGK
jgi:GlcNAc-P-P-Und epimerase